MISVSCGWINSGRRQYWPIRAIFRVEYFSVDHRVVLGSSLVAQVKEDFRATSILTLLRSDAYNKVVGICVSTSLIFARRLYPSMPEFKDTDLVLNFNDAVIYGSDLALLQSPTAWLNDACVHFFLEWLQARAQAAPTCKFMDPSVVSFFVHQCTDEDEIEEFVANTSFPDHGKIFIPVNDSMANAAPWRGGSHWTLLLIIRSNNGTEYWHFDSVKNSGNGRAANDISQKLGKHCFGGSSRPQVVGATTPQQFNGYDCGLYMLAAVQLFSTMKEVDLKSHEANLLQYVTEHPDFCKELRRHVADGILKLSKST